MKTHNFTYGAFETFAEDGDKGIVTGKAVLYNTPVPFGWGGGSLLFTPGCFGKVGKTPCLYQHNSEQPIGTLTVLSDQKDALYIRCDLLINDVQLARETFALVKAGAITGFSVGVSWGASGAVTKNNKTIINKANLREVSLVTFPAFNGARTSATYAQNGLNDTINQHMRQLYGQ